MPELRRPPGFLLLAGALALAGLGAHASASAPAAKEAIGRARTELVQGNGIAAEVNLGKALDAGASRADVAALMGEAMLAQDNLPRAREWLGPAQFSPATAATGFRNLGRLEQREGNLPLAGQAYDRALALAPRDAGLWIDIARLRYAGGEHFPAIEAIDHALELDSAYPRALEFKGQVVRDREGNAAALPWFERGLAIAPADMGLMAEYAATLGEMGRARDMLAVSRRMVETNSRDPRAYFQQAVLAARAGRIDVARQLMNRTRGKLADVPSAILLEGILELRAGNPDVAVSAFERLVQRQPGNARARLLLARALSAAHADLYLVQQFTAQAERPDASPYLLTLVGRAYENLGQRDRAAPFLDRAASASQPFVSPAWAGSPLGALIDGGRLGEARAMAGQSLAAKPGSADAMVQAGDAELAAGESGAAWQFYARSAEVRLGEDTFLRMIEALSRAGRGGEAAGLASGYLARHPQSRAAVRLSAGLAAQAGDWGRARALLEYLAKTGTTRDARLFADLSLVRLRTGDKPGALAAAEAGWQLQRANPSVARAMGMALAAGGKDPERARRLLEKSRQTGGEPALIAEGLALLGRPAAN